MATPNFAKNQAAFAVHVSSVDVSEKLNPYLTSLTVQQTSSHGADTATIDLADNYGELALPSIGEPVSIDLGWVGWGSMRVFEGFTQEIHSMGSRSGGRHLLIHCEGVNFSGSLFKFPRELHKDQGTFQATAAAFGAMAGFDVLVHSSLGSSQRDWWGMNGESFGHWGQRMASEIGATFRVSGNKAVFLPRSGGLSATGKSLGSVTADFRGPDGTGNGISWDIIPQMGRPPHQSFSTRFFDMAKTTWNVVTQAAKSGNVASAAMGLLRFGAPDEGQAKDMSNSAALETARNVGQGSVTIVGDPEAQVDAECVVMGAREGVDGPYTIDQLEHRYSRNEGFMTTLMLVQPGFSLFDSGGSGGDAGGAPGLSSPSG